MSGVAIKPGSPEHLRMITPSKVAAILGVSRWKSQYTLWHEMAGIIDPAPISEAKQDDFDYGHAAELAAREYWKIKNPGWRISRGEVQISNPDLPFPNVATIDLRASRGKHRRVVEVKTARDLGEFGDDGSGEIPRDYAAQVLMQMVITGWHDTADVVVWAQFGKPRIYHVEYDADIADALVKHCHLWMLALSDGIKPVLDNTISTYETVKALHPDIDGSAVEVSPELARQVLDWSRELQATEKTVCGLKSELLDLMGNAQTAVVGDIKIADRRPHARGGVALALAHKNYDALTQAHPDPRFTTEGVTA